MVILNGSDESEAPIYCVPYLYRRTRGYTKAVILTGSLRFNNSPSTHCTTPAALLVPMSINLYVLMSFCLCLCVCVWVSSGCK